MRFLCLCPSEMSLEVETMNIKKAAYEATLSVRPTIGLHEKAMRGLRTLKRRVAYCLRWIQENDARAALLDRRIRDIRDERFRKDWIIYRSGL